MARPPLAGALAKIGRAQEHIDTLRNDFLSVMDKQLCDPAFKPRMQCIERVQCDPIEAVRLRISRRYLKFINGQCFAPVIHAEEYEVSIRRIRHELLPVMRWGAIVGDVVHNLRSALDQLVWELTVKHQATLGHSPPQPPFKQGSIWRDAQFAVAATARAWQTAITSGSMRGINPSLHNVLEHSQPFRLGPRYQRHWLWLLQQLWNADKHRTITFVTNDS